MAADHANQTLLGIFVVFLAAQIGSEVAQRLRMPSVVGQIIAGCVVGPSVLGWVTVTEPLEVLAEIGAVLLLFSVGLEIRAGDLRKVGSTAVKVGVLGVVLPFVFGAIWAVLSGFDGPKAMFVASAFVATSAGITARVLQELGVIQRTESRVILAAAVIDDVLAMLLLGVVSALQTKGGIDVVGLAIVLGEALAFVGVVVVLGVKVMRRSSQAMEAPIDPDSPLALSLCICLGLAVAAAYTGLAAIIGAFLAGMILAETDHRECLESDIKPIMAFVTPFFFVVTGTKVDVSVLAQPAVLLTLLVVTVLAIVSKLAGGWLGARSLGGRSALVVGVGMVPRGEVGIIVASLGEQAKVFAGSTYALIVAMSLTTSIVAPPVLKLLMAKVEPEVDSESDPESEPTGT